MVSEPNLGNDVARAGFAIKCLVNTSHKRNNGPVAATRDPGMESGLLGLGVLVWVCVKVPSMHVACVSTPLY